ncbi:MAG: hypothetical protein K6G48_00585 [Acholeplasmatales bacterium]|nr:hypothetical protein [Acholeplasmatales bacterium]
MNNKLVELKNELEENIKGKERVVNALSYSRLVVFVLALVLYLMAPYKEGGLKIALYVIVIALTIAFIVLIVVHQIKYNALDYMKFEIASINDYELRLNNKYQRFKDGGEEFKNEDNYYEYDLDLFGKASVYKYLNVSRTAYGRKAFAFALKDKDTSEDIIRERQDAVRELASDPKTHIELEAISRIYEKRVDDRRATSMDNALSLVENEVHTPSYEIAVGIFSNIMVILSIVLACLKVVGYGYIAGAILISFILNTYIIASIKEIRANVIPINNLFSGYDNYISYMKQKSFSSKALNDIKNTLESGSEKGIKQFNILNGFISSGSNILFSVIFNGLFALDAYLSVLYAHWQKKYAHTIRNTVEAVGDLEGYLSLSSIALTRDDCIMPEISSDFKFKNLKHPLIDYNKCIGNDFVFNDLNIITGSNMSGKTTFMRSIGVNYLLFKAGGYVVAESFSASIYKLFTSMKVSDDVTDGISTFYAEILRVKSIIDYTKENKPMLVLIDEIFKGTNTKDRLVGAKSVLEHLRRDGIKAIITTHDLELCDAEGVMNYHFLEHYEDDKILFDYKIHDGISKTRNAIYLLKLAGIIEE